MKRVLSADLTQTSNQYIDADNARTDSTTRTEATPPNAFNSGSAVPRLINREPTHSPMVRDEETGESNGIPMAPTPLETGDNDARNNVDAMLNFSAVLFVALERAAMSGEEYAQLELGRCFESGDNVEKDVAQAATWYRLAADQGNALAQNNLAELHCKGEGVDQDHEQAFFWWHKAANQGHAASQNNLADMYASGVGVKKDYDQAFFWWHKAADQGHAMAQSNLAVSYFKGDSVDQDYAKAADWHRKAADQGCAFSQGYLGLMYANGEAGKQDYVQAATWLRKAASQGHRSSQLLLAEMYCDGLGVEQDLAMAIYLLLHAGLSDDLKSITVSVAKHLETMHLIPDTLMNYPEFQHVSELKFCDFPEEATGIVGPVFAALIQSNPALTTIQAPAYTLDPTEAALILEALAVHISLTTFHFDDQYLEAPAKARIATMLAQNKTIPELREHLRTHPIIRSDELPIEVLSLVADELLVNSIKQGQSKEATQAALDAFLLSAGSKTLEQEGKKFS